jgi:hypothetical protein
MARNEMGSSRHWLVDSRKSIGLPAYPASFKARYTFSLVTGKSRTLAPDAAATALATGAATGMWGLRGTAAAEDELESRLAVWTGGDRSCIRCDNREGFGFAGDRVQEALYA